MDNTDTTSGVDASAAMRRATIAAVLVASLLIAVKLVAWLLSGSVAVLSSLMDSSLDVLASLVNLIAVRHALTPPDREHRFGHGKAEALAGLGQSGFVAGSAALLTFESIRRLTEPQQITHEALGIGVMLFSIVATVALVRYQRVVVRRTGSVAIKADSLHYAGDVLMNIAVIASLGLTAAFGWTFVDPLFALSIAAYILWNARKILMDSLDVLMDRELPDEDRERISAIARTHPKVKALHDLKTRRAGTDIFIQMHLEMDGAMTLHQAHKVADDVEEELMAAYPGAEVIIHQDPEGVDEQQQAFD